MGSDTNKDVGLALQYHTGSAAKTAFLGYDDSAGKLTFIPDATLSSEVVSGTAGTIVAALEGNASTATTLVNARTIGGTSFDGSANIAVALSATATALATGRTIGMTGDVVWTSASFTGSGNVTGAATIQAGSVENSMLADDAVGADELASNAVVTASIVDANVTNAKLNIDYTVSTSSNTLGTAPNIYSGTAGQTAFTIKKVKSSTSYGVNDVLVFWQGLCLEPTTDYTISGSTLTFDQAVKAGDHIAVRYLPVSG